MKAAKLRNFALIFVTLFSLSSGFAQNTSSESAEPPRRTYLIQLQNVPSIHFAKLMQSFGSKCYRISDVAEATVETSASSAPQECHSFGVFENRKQIKGSYPTPGSTYLVRVKSLGKTKRDQWRYSIEFFHNAGHKEVTRFANPGEFRFPSDFQVESGMKAIDQETALIELRKTITNLTFK